MADKKEITEEIKEKDEAVKEAAEEVKETAEEVKEAAEEVKETAEEAKEAAEEIKETAETEAEAVAEEAEAAETEVLSSTENKRRKKAERREAKAARKAANAVEEKKSRPNNLLLAILIFGVVIGMFAFIGGYNYYQKYASIEKYIEKNGGEEAYSGMYVDEHSTADLTAQGNSMKLDITCTPHDEEDEAKELTDYYKSDDGLENVKYMGAYFLTTIKPECRGLTSDVTVTVKVGDDEVVNEKMSYREAKKFIEELQEKAEEEADNEDADASGDADAEEIELDADDIEAEGGDVEVVTDDAAADDAGSADEAE